MALRITELGRALYSGGVDKADVLILGDSITEGTGVTTITQRPGNLLQDRLRTQLSVLGGIGYVEAKNQSNSIVDDPTLSAGTTVVNNVGLGLKGVAPNTGTVTYMPQVCTSIRVFVSAISNAGLLGVSIDGGAPIPVSCNHSLGEYREKFFDIPISSVPASHTVVVTRYATGTGLFPNPILSGIVFFNGDEALTSYLNFPGASAGLNNIVGMASIPALSLTANDHTFRAKFRANAIGTGADQYLISKWDSLASAKSFILSIGTNGKPTLYLATDAAPGTTLTHQSNGPALPQGQDVWLEAKVVRNNGAGSRTIDFRISTAAADLAQEDGDLVTGWVAHGTQITGAVITVLDSNTIALRSGGALTGAAIQAPFAGRMYALQVKDGATTVADARWGRTNATHVASRAGSTWVPASGVTQTLLRTGTGIRIFSAAQSGLASAGFAGGVTGGNVLISDLAPWVTGTASSVAIIWVGANDYLTNVNPTTFGANIQTVVNSLREGDPNLAFVLVAGWRPNSTQTYTWSQYVAQLQAVKAATSGIVEILDLSMNWPQPGTPEGTSSGYYSDLVHPTVVGNTAVADRLFSLFFEEEPAPISLTLPPTPTPPPPEYTFISADLRTNRIINEIPMRQDTKFGRVLNGTGTLEGRLPLGDPRFSGVDILDATEPNRRVIYVDRDGELIWGGIVWGRKYNSSKAEMAITAVEFFSYFIRRFLRVNSATLFSNTAVDQFDIMRAFVNYVQSETGGDLGITMTNTDSGVLRDREWFSYERKQIGEAIQQLSAVIDGFDFEIGVRYDQNDLPERFLGLYYPRAGRVSQQTGLLFDKPGNLVSFDYDEDGTAQSTRTDAIGAGEGDLMLLKTAMDSNLLNQGYPLLEQVVDYKDVIIPSTLQAHADGDQQEDRLPFTIMKLRVNSGMTGLNEFVLGDEARVKIEPGDPRFPEGFDDSRRIIGWDIQPGATTMELTTENRLSA